MAKLETKYGGPVKRNAQDKDMTRVHKGMLSWQLEDTEATPVKGRCVRRKLAGASATTAVLGWPSETVMTYHGTLGTAFTSGAHAALKAVKQL